MPDPESPRPYARLVVGGEALIAVGILGMLSGCAVGTMMAFAGWIYVGVSGASGGVFFIAVGYLLRFFALRAQNAAR